jgi:4a-hydroxytetrahydrobiopterin dehydratase
MAHLLDEEERRAALAKLPGWTETPERNAIRKSFKFKSFNEAFAFMTRAALMAEKLDHHPDWSNVYNRVEVTLSTHSAGGVTDLDIAFAKKMNGF